jgi:transcriptional regulator with XRE-family HTH domain
MNDTGPDVRLQFAAYLERLRISSGLSVAELALRSKLEVDEVEAILRGKAKLPLDVILLLAGGLMIPPGTFIDDFPELPEVD